MAFSIAVIGCGWIAQNSHGPAYQRYAAEHADVELASCCDTDAQRAAAYAARFGFKRSYADYRAMLEAERPSAVCLNVPVALICELGCEVMRRGFALLCEKPPGRTLAEIDRLIEVARARGTIHQVAFNRRFAPLVSALKARLDGREVQHIDLHFFRVGRVREDFSTTAIHGIDTVRFLAGSDFASARLSYQDLPAGGANFFLDCRFASGASAALSFCPDSGMTVERAAVHASGSTFSLAMNLGPDAPGWLRQYDANRPVLDLDGADFSGSREDFVLSGFLAEDTAFFDAVRAGQQPAHDFASCRPSVGLMEALRERRPSYPADGR